MGLFGKKKKVVDPKYVEMNNILAQSLINSKVPEGVDEETNSLIGVIVSTANIYAEEMMKGMGFVTENGVMKFISQKYNWIDKENLNRIAKRAVDRVK